MSEGASELEPDSSTISAAAASFEEYGPSRVIS
jgi:hypothetical protein